MVFFNIFNSNLRAQKKAEQDEERRLSLQRLRHSLGMTTFTFEGDLGTSEIWWRDHFLWLKDNGYHLRSRYAPGWVPSWNGTDKDWSACEDSLWLLVRFTALRNLNINNTLAASQQCNSSIGRGSCCFEACSAIPPPARNRNRSIPYY